MRVLLISMFFILSASGSDCIELLLQFKQQIIPVDKYTSHIDWEVEKYFPNIQIKNGHLPRSSRAFIVWRQNSSPWIPDTAFLFHYLGRDEIARELGFLVPDVVDHVSVSGVKIAQNISNAAKQYMSEYYQKQKELFLFPINRTLYKPKKVADTNYGSVSKMLDQLSLNFHATQHKWNALIDNQAEKVRWLVTGDGRAYLWTGHESETLLNATDIIGTHGDILALVTDHPEHVGSFPEVASIIAYGEINFKNGIPDVPTDPVGGPFSKGKEGNFDFLEYLRVYFHFNK